MQQCNRNTKNDRQPVLLYQLRCTSAHGCLWGKPWNI